MSRASSVEEIRERLDRELDLCQTCLHMRWEHDVAGCTWKHCGCAGFRPKHPKFVRDALHRGGDDG